MQTLDPTEMAFASYAVQRDGSRLTVGVGVEVVGVTAIGHVLDSEQPGPGVVTDANAQSAVVVDRDRNFVGLDSPFVVNGVISARAGLEPHSLPSEGRYVLDDELGGEQMVLGHEPEPRCVIGYDAYRCAIDRQTDV